MSNQPDVYRDWLEISETARPLNHYQLLKLKLFEDDANVIRGSYRKLNAHVRKYASGEFGPRSQELLNELCQAMLCLTDAVRKTEYDASLGRSAAPAAGKAKTFEELLVARKVLTAEQLDKARRFSRTIGVDVRDAIFQQRLAPADQVMQVYADSIGLPFINLEDVEIDETLAPKMPAVTARQQSCAPLMAVDGRVLVMAPHLLPPEIEDLLRLQFGLPVRTVLCTPADVNQVIAKHYPKEAAAAQLAAGPTKRAAAPPPEAKATGAKETGAAPPAAQAGLTYEEKKAAKKQRLMTCFLVANFCVIVFMIGLSATTQYLVRHAVLSSLAGLAFWAVVFGATWVVTELKRG